MAKKTTKKKTKRTKAKTTKARAKPKAVASVVASVDMQSEKMDMDLARAAVAKRKAGKTPTARELSALRKIEKEQEEKLRWKYYRSIPKKHWLKMSGRPAQVINDQAANYGLPIGDAVIDLPDFIRAFHDFLKRNSRKLSRDEDDPMMSGENTQAIERYRLAKAKLAEMELEDRRKETINRDELHAVLGKMAGLFRGCGEALQKQYGPDALELLNETLEDVEAVLKQNF